ncbi:Transcription initiation factor TFIID subunit 12 [Hibiscus syriacus]|uniref:Transcription initiation factor TFIID subunit 12 n=1 Tax=Hibiscus syriacus TaxID=106335 RepID=A0A6A3BUA4_HIBSY|nr:Transcription initiation factor TFIID subunit 12 [Hibiscus syriacus]
MDQQPPPQPSPSTVPAALTPTPPNATASSSDPSQQQPQQQPPLSQPPTPSPQQPQLSQTSQIQQQPSQPFPSRTPSTFPSPNLNPKPLPKPQQPPQPRPALSAPQPRIAATFLRPWQQQSSHFINSSSSSPSVTSTPAPTLSSQPRGSINLGAPSSHSSPSPPSPSPSPSQPSPFSGSFGHSFTGASSSNVSQSRPPMQGMTIGSHSQMRPPGISAQHQQRPLQSSLRPPSLPNSQSPATQNFQGHGSMRVSAVGSSTPSTLQTSQVHNQPWLSSGSQGKPPLPPPSFRPQINSPSLQQRSHIPQQHHSSPTVPQQQHVSSPQLPQSSSLQPQEHFRQQMSPTPGPPQSLPHQQPPRAQGSVNQKPSSLATVQPSTVQLVNQNKAALTETDESGGKILTKRSIHDLLNQIDPSEKLDPEVEDILVDIAEDFVDSITTFGCSLAKHRKSDTLEAKDILLHLERNWNMILPGFTGDEIKTYRKPLTNEVHKERLAAIKKSIVVSGVNAKGNLGKVGANILGSPNVKI